MKADFYKAIKDTLASIGKVSIWNAGLLNDSDRLGKFPLLFLEFTGINYQTTGKNTQECNGAAVTLHILYNTIDSEDAGIFDTSQQVYAAMQRAGFNRTGERPDYSGGEVIDWIMTFESPRWIDEDAVEEKINTKKPPLSPFNLL